MRPEFYLLGATLLLALVHIFWAGNARTRQYGTAWNMGARDAQMPPLAPLPARLLRAQANLFETLPLFIGALLGAAVVGRLGWKTEAGAHLYFWGRLIYLPLYAAGIPKVRTFVWMVATLGLLFVVAGLMLG
ncbi:MAPEG family protein [uncultured Sphingomonas sp.]|uniref:MAPEG family protein n=1 Tax=uncultured Sphingomonas sp. TaxID=158754 RepID=UPI0025EE7FDE|nr:MAPEG family protein [uncultured Sphingomonas sp.]